MEKSGFKKWIPTSKMSAVGVGWGLISYGTFALTEWHKLVIDPVSAVSIAGGLLFFLGYAITEHRCGCEDLH